MQITSCAYLLDADLPQVLAKHSLLLHIQPRGVELAIAPAANARVEGIEAEVVLLTARAGRCLRFLAFEDNNTSFN